MGGIAISLAGGFGPNRMAEIKRRMDRVWPQVMLRVGRDAEKLLKMDYLKRGGSFTVTKNAGTPTGRRGGSFGRRAKTRTSGYQWVKNPGNQLRWGTGNLARSWIHVFPKKNGRGEWQAQVVSRGVPYARIHEYGGFAGRGKKMLLKKRPYLEPMIKEQNPKWVGWLYKDMHAAFKP